MAIDNVIDQPLSKSELALIRKQIAVLAPAIERWRSVDRYEQFDSISTARRAHRSTTA